MTDTAITITAIIGFLSGAATIGMWLGPALSRVRTERDRLQSVVDELRSQLEFEREIADREYDDAQLMEEKIATITSDCLEFQRLAHQAQDGLDMAKDMLSGEIAAHRTTKRQLAAAKGQITKLKRRIEG